MSNESMLKRKKELDCNQKSIIIALFIACIVISCGVDKLISIWNQDWLNCWIGDLEELIGEIWGAQFAISFITLTLLSLMANNMNDRILGIRIGSWLLKYNVYILNLWECTILIALINVFSFAMLILLQPIHIVISFIFICGLILYSCNLSFSMFYKRSKIYYKISMKINKTNDKDDKVSENTFNENNIIKKIREKASKLSQEKNEDKRRGKLFTCSDIYYREEVVILSQIYFKLGDTEEDNKSKELLTRAILDILISNGDDIKNIFESVSNYNDEAKALHKKLSNTRIKLD